MLPVINFFSINIPTYLLVISTTYCLCLFWIVRRADRLSSKRFNFDRNTTLDIALAIMVGGFLGARFLHIIYEAPHYYLEDPMRIFKVWQGGFVFYGGAIGAGLSFYLLALKQKLDIPRWLDLYAPVLPFGYAIGRLSCLAAGCCYGRPTTLFWGITFPHGVEAPAGISLHPTQLYAFFWEISLFLLLIFLERKNQKEISSEETNNNGGQLFLIWFIGHSLGRLFMEYFRDDQRGPSLNLIAFNLSISSVISLLILAVALLFLLKSYKNK